MSPRGAGRQAAGAAHCVGIFSVLSVFRSPAPLSVPAPAPCHLTLPRPCALPGLLPCPLPPLWPHPLLSLCCEGLSPGQWLPLVGIQDCCCVCLTDGGLWWVSGEFLRGMCPGLANWFLPWVPRPLPNPRSLCPVVICSVC